MQLVIQLELGLPELSEGLLVAQKELELVMKLAVQLEKGCFQSSEEECFRMFRMSPFWKIRILHQI